MNSPHKVGCALSWALAFLVTLPALAQSAKQAPLRERLLGAWHLVRIDAPGPNRKIEDGPPPKGLLVYTPDGHTSVQLMYPQSASTLSNEYVRNGYEASFGSYEVDEAAHTVTHHVQGSITGDALVGKDLSRRLEFTADGHLLIRSTRADEHWSVTWEHY